jgi:hypothetical protein
MARKGPLRKVVGQVNRPWKLEDGREIDSWYEVLECGHEQRPVSDIYGETYAYRRRCRQCLREGKSETKGATR